MKTYYESSEGQMIVDRTFALVPFFWGLLVKALIYFPLLLTGYALTRLFLPKSAEGYYWVGCIVLIAMGIYCLLMFLKGVLLALKWRERREWILVFGICVLYTCIPPSIVIHYFLRSWVHYPVLNDLLSASFGFWVYTRYHFLLDLVPERFWVFYSAGLRAGGFKPGSVG
jgi:hypothetical protein